MDRRTVLLTGLGALAAIPFVHTRARGRAGSRIPLIHSTDLYHPPQDPDDHIDLATVAALGEFDLRGVVCDVTRKFLTEAPAGVDVRRDPGIIPLTQLAHLLKREIRFAAGPPDPLAGPEDDCRNRTDADQEGILFLLDLLRECESPAVISIVGSARVLTAAYNRDPRLVRSRVRAVLLNAGSTGGPKVEWNVGLDPAAYVGLWQSGLPIWWYPCATEGGAFNPDHEHGTYWSATHAELFRGLSPGMRAWFEYALTGERNKDPIEALRGWGGQERWEETLRGRRNLWATASLVMGAGRSLVRTPSGWRFCAAEGEGEASVWPWRCDPIAASVDNDARVRWTPAPAGGNALLFWRRKGKEFGDAMGEALGALLASLPG